jgi:protein-arginine kinase
MAITSKIDRVRNLTIYAVRGDITAEELRSSAKMFWESPTLTLNLIWDVREATFTRMKYKEMDDILFHLQSYADRFSEREIGKTAIVVNSDDQFAVMRQLSSHASIQCLPIIPQVFKTMGEAMAWIDQTEYDFITALKESRDDNESKP